MTGFRRWATWPRQLRNAPAPDVCSELQEPRGQRIHRLGGCGLDLGGAAAKVLRPGEQRETFGVFRYDSEVHQVHDQLDCGSSLVVTGPFDVVTIVGSGSEMSRSQTQGSTPLASTPSTRARGSSYRRMTTLTVSHRSHRHDGGWFPSCQSRRAKWVSAAPWR